MFKLSFLFLLFFFCNMLKIPFLGIGFSYLTPLLIIFNLRDVKKILFIVFGIIIFIGFQLIFNQTSFLEILNFKYFLFILTGSIFGSYVYRANPKLTINSLLILSSGLIFLFLTTFLFRTDPLFQYSRFNGEVFAGAFPIYLKTNRISFSGLASDPNQIAAGFLLIYSLIKDKFIIKELIVLFILSIVLDAKFIALSILIISFIIYFKLEANKFNRYITYFSISTGIFILSRGFTNSRYKIWYGYITRFTKDGISLFGYDLDKINLFEGLFRYTHNTFLDLYLYTGIIGLTIFSFLLISYVRQKNHPLVRFLGITLAIFPISFFSQPIFYTLLTVLVFGFIEKNYLNKEVSDSFQG